MINRSRRVVVTGIGVCTPLGCGTELFWKNLLKGVSGIYSTGDGLSFLPSRVAGFVSDNEIESRKLKLLKKLESASNKNPLLSWRSVSRATIFALLAASEALLQAGIVSDHSTDSKITKLACGRIGVHFGAGMEGIAELVQTAYAIEVEKNYRAIGPHALTRSLANMPAGVISRVWNLQGPCMASNTACATGLHSIGDAYRMIQHGEADLMVAGGCEAPISSWAMASFCRIRALATRFNDEPHCASRPFDEDRDGFVMSEGAGAVVLQAWPPAESIKSFQRSEVVPIAEVLGYGRSGDAHNLVSPEPSGDGAYRSMVTALHDAQLTDASEVSHINCHATSTPVGDEIELAAIARFLDTHSKNNCSSSSMVINSIKGHLGHTLAASSAIEAAYTALSLQHGRIPGNRNLFRTLSLDKVRNVLLSRFPAKVAESCTDRLKSETTIPLANQIELPWPDQPSRRRIALTNSFGFGGTNASLILGQWIK